MLGKGIHDAVALARAHFAHLDAPGAVELQARADAVAVALLPDQVYGQEVVAIGRRIEPQHVVDIAGGGINLGVASVNVQPAIVVEVADGKGFDPVVVEKAGDFGKSFIAIIAKKVVAGASHQQIDEAIVVKIAHDGLDGQPLYDDAAGSGNISKDPAAVVFQQHAGLVVVGDKAIQIAVVVDIHKFGRPGLSADFEVVICGHLGEIAVAIIDEEGVDAAGVGGVIDALAAFGDVEVEVAIVVKIGPNAAVIARIVRSRHGSHVDPVVGGDEVAEAIIGPDAALGIVVAGKIIDEAIVVNVYQIGGLHKQIRAGQGADGIRAASILGPDQLDAIVAAASEHFVEAVVVQIGDADAPLALVGDRPEAIAEELSPPGLLIFDHQVAPLRQAHDIVQPIAVHIRHRDGYAAADVGVGQALVGVGKADLPLCEQRHEKGESDSCVNF